MSIRRMLGNAHARPMLSEMESIPIVITQEELMPKEDLSPYIGQWVLLRGGYVIAHASQPTDITKRYEVKNTDVLMPVPDGGKICIFASGEMRPLLSV